LFENTELIERGGRKKKLPLARNERKESRERERKNCQKHERKNESVFLRKNEKKWKNNPAQ